MSKTVITPADLNTSTGHLQVVGNKVEVNAPSVIGAATAGSLPLSALVTSASTSGQILTSTGAATAPTFQAPTVGTHTHVAADITDFSAAADARIANALSTASAAYDTLIKIANGMAADDTSATAMLTSIGEKVAKAGDTMTGFLTLSAAPTANLHAATKSYADGVTSELLVSMGGVTLGYIKP